MDSKKNLNWKLISFNIIEVFLILTVGIILEFLDNRFTPNNKHIGLLISIVGTFIVLSRIIITETNKENFKEGIANTQDKLDSIHDRLNRLSEVIDLKEESKVSSIKKLLDLYLNITEKEFIKVKDGLISETIDSLNKLKNNKRSEELVASEYYEWLLPILENIGNGENIKAVSCMFDSEWDDSPAERKFITGNINAARKGAKVERVFIMKKTLLVGALKQLPIRYHSKGESESNLQGFIADRDDLERKEPSLLSKIGHGFIIFNSHVALIDKFDELGQVRGIVTMNEKDINDLDKAFNRLKYYSNEIEITNVGAEELTQSKL